MTTKCPSCDTELAMAIIEVKGTLRPLKSPWLACANVACCRKVNTITGGVFYNGKLIKEQNNEQI